MRTNNAVRSDARAAIVAAAEALYQRGGGDAVTLSAVAREADFARGVIYAHFSSRQELLAEVAPAEAVGAAVEAEVADSYDAAMQAQAEALRELSQQVIVPRTRDATEAALARLEARVSVTETSLKALEQRMGEQLKSLDVDTGGLSERLHSLRQRLEKFEERQTAALAELRLDVHHLRHGGPLPELEPPASEPVDEEMAEPALVEPAVEAGGPEGDKLAVEPRVTMPAYLASARRAANDAAVLRAAQPVRRRPKWLRFVGKRRWAILAVAAALVVWFDVYVFAHYQPAEGAVMPTAALPTPPTITAKPQWSPRAQLVRGLKYLNGTGVPADATKARLWIERAALRGQPVAQNLMGVIYQTGTGVDANVPVAIGWYETAAGHGNLKAMTNLGKLYAGGWTSGTNFAKAAEWFAKAAAYGDVDACFDLAILYERGEGVPRNLPQAYKWYAIAGALGDRHAGERAMALASDLTAEERDAADAAVTVFKPQAVAKDANQTPPIAG